MAIGWTWICKKNVIAACHFLYWYGITDFKRIRCEKSDIFLFLAQRPGSHKYNLVDVISVLKSGHCVVMNKSGHCADEYVSKPFLCALDSYFNAHTLFAPVTCQSIWGKQLPAHILHWDYLIY